MKMNQIEVYKTASGEIGLSQLNQFEDDDCIAITTDQAEIIATEILRIAKEIRGE